MKTIFTLSLISATVLTASHSQADQVTGSRSKKATITCKKINHEVEPSNVKAMTFKVDLLNKTVKYQSRLASEWLEAKILSAVSEKDYFSNRTSSDGNSEVALESLVTFFAKAAEEDEMFDTLIINSASSRKIGGKTTIGSSVILTVHNESDGTPSTPAVYTTCNTVLN